jgi:hypothetical protein
MDRENKKFRLYFESPFINFTAEAETLEALNEIASNLNLMGFDSKILSDLNIEAAIRRALVIYREAYCSGKKRSNSLSLRGVELDAIRCFLEGRKLQEAISLIREGKGIKISQSALERIYQKLQKIGIVPGLFPRSEIISKQKKQNFERV